MSDLAFSEDDFIKLFAGLLLAAHVGAFVWSWRGRGIAPVVWLNLVTSGAVVALWLPGLGSLFDYVGAVALFVAFEFAVFALSLAAVLRAGVPRGAIWTAFAINAILVAAALVFFLTFQMRLF